MRHLATLLRHRDRSRIAPWRGYLRLFLAAVSRLQARSEPLYRGVARDLRSDYAEDPTVIVTDTPEEVSLRKVVGTNQTYVGIAAAGEVAVITAALDNLIKGAAGQALQNFNVACGFDERTGLQ